VRGPYAGGSSGVYDIIGEREEWKQRSEKKRREGGEKKERGRNKEQSV